MRHLGLCASGAVTLAAFAVLLWAPNGEAQAPPVTDQGASETFEPLILFADDRLVSCGFRAVFVRDARTTSADIVLQRTGDTAEWVVSVRDPQLPASGPPPSDLGLKTVSHDTRTTFSAPKVGDTGSFEVRGTLEGLDGSTFIQEIMIQGATIAIADASGRRAQWAFTGPLPQAVRASYLMCAGDLFRP